MDIMEENGTHFDENKKNLLSDVLDIGEIFTSMLLIWLSVFYTIVFQYILRIISRKTKIMRKNTPTEEVSESEAR